MSTIEHLHRYIHTMSPEAVIFWSLLAGWLGAAFVGAFPPPKPDDNRMYVIWYNFIQGLAANFPWKRKNGQSTKVSSNS